MLYSKLVPHTLNYHHAMISWYGLNHFKTFQIGLLCCGHNATIIIWQLLKTSVCFYHEQMVNTHYTHHTAFHVTPWAMCFASLQAGACECKLFTANDLINFPLEPLYGTLAHMVYANGVYMFGKHILSCIRIWNIWHSGKFAAVYVPMYSRCLWGEAAYIVFRAHSSPWMCNIQLLPF